VLRIGVDDTDSKDGMCTTYVGAMIVDRLTSHGIELADFPHLIRLNPNVPWKTRGNCAICIVVRAEGEQIATAKEIVLSTVEELAELHVETTNPGVVFYQGEGVPIELKGFSKKVVQDIVTIDEAEALAGKIGAEVHKFKLGRGIIGALAAIGNTLDEDWTFELIAYRARENWGKPRRIDEASVRRMNDITYPNTFDNLDPTTGEIRITPHTPCPVLYGIRGESPEAVEEAHRLVTTFEPIDRWTIYKTNQGTDEHLRPARIGEIKPFWSVIVDGIVCEKPRVIVGGHVIFKIQDGTGQIDCAAYEPTRHFREVVKKLHVGDMVRVYGGVKEKPGLPLTINLEKISIIKLAPIFRKVNPSCPKCGKRMKSEGRGKGYSCKRCKIKAPANAAKLQEVERATDLGTFEVPVRCRRHLAKPLAREIYVKFPKREF
jgi:tRNA(Ile2)-agmatinylcytidine synthase